MSRLLALAAVLVPSIAIADPGAAPAVSSTTASTSPAGPEEPPLVVGGFLGPRVFSQISTLGYIDNAPYHPMLQASVELGGRLSHAFLFPWFHPEVELALSPTSTNALGGAAPASVLWLEPRVQLRFDPPLPPRYRRYHIQPFALIGAGSPIALSSARKTIDSGITGDGYLGLGARFDTGKGFAMRFDWRLALVPGVQISTGDPRVGFETELAFGVDVPLGTRRGGAAAAPDESTTSDRDGDGIVDSKDRCPDRPEDRDGFQDDDGCPDIDNDGDKVLDIADKCPTEQETQNGYQDEDGCPDEVPADVTAIEGTIERLIYADGETAVRDSARPTLHKIAKVMAKYPSIELVLVGHSDGQEAKAFATPDPGQPPPDVDQIAIDLSKSRAEAVRQALITMGVAAGRLRTDGVGAAEPVADDATKRGRLANRRVEVKLFVENP